MSPFTAVDALSLFDQLGRMDAKSEIIGGEIVPMTPTGPWPGFATDEVFVALRAYVRRTGTGVACADGKVFRVQLPGDSLSVPMPRILSDLSGRCSIMKAHRRSLSKFVVQVITGHTPNG